VFIELKQNIKTSRIEPLHLANGRYMAVTPERKILSVGRWGIAVACNRCKFVTVSIVKRLRDGRFNYETAV
jgi:hypothetical protein